MKRDHTIRLVGIALLLLIWTEGLFACPVCYGPSDSLMAEGVNAAVLFLLGITGTVLAAFAMFFIYLRKRSRMTLDGKVDFPSVN